MSIKELYWKVRAEISAWLDLISEAFKNWKSHQVERNKNRKEIKERY